MSSRGMYMGGVPLRLSGDGTSRAGSHPGSSKCAS